MISFCATRSKSSGQRSENLGDGEDSLGFRNASSRAVRNSSWMRRERSLHGAIAIDLIHDQVGSERSDLHLLTVARHHRLPSAVSPARVDDDPPLAMRNDHVFAKGR